MSWAAALLAMALLVGATPASASRLSRRSTPAVVTNPSAGPSGDLLAVASSLDVLAACLSSGMAVASAAAATGESAPRPLADVLNRAASLLALGADARTAWSAPQPGWDQRMAALQRLAIRSASSGAALARGVADLADEARLDAGDEARAAAERAAVLIAGPLGLCYLPAFVCLGIVPVIAGLATDVLRMGVL
jgi:pilus assembly protein TadC